MKNKILENLLKLVKKNPAYWSVIQEMCYKVDLEQIILLKKSLYNIYIKSNNNNREAFSVDNF